MKRLVFDLSWSLTEWLFAEAYMREIVVFLLEENFLLLNMHLDR